MNGYLENVDPALRNAATNLVNEEIKANREKGALAQAEEKLDLLQTGLTWDQILRAKIARKLNSFSFRAVVKDTDKPE